MSFGPVTYNPDGTFDAVYVTPHNSKLHHFHGSVSQASYIKNYDGSDDTKAITTGELVCTDIGCGQSIDVVFPLLGDAIAQQANVMFRLATTSPAITLQQAAQLVISEIGSLGGTSRIDENGQPK